MTRPNEIRIICDMSAAHTPNRPQIVAAVFSRNHAGVWSSRTAVTIRQYGEGGRWYEDGSEPNENEAIRFEVPVAHETVTGVVVHDRREVFHVRCKICMNPDLWMRWERAQEVLENLRHAGRNKLTPSELDTILGM